MTFSDKIKDYLVLHYGGEKSSWKRMSKKKTNSGMYIRKFVSTIPRYTYPIFVLSDDKTETIIDSYGNNVPTGFIICIPDSSYTGIDQDIDNVDEAVEYYSKYDPENEDGGYEESLPYVMVNTGDPDDKSEISDQHVTQYIEKALGISVFDKFDETCENTLVLHCKMTLKEIREYFEKAGLEFLGYQESDF